MYLIYEILTKWAAADVPVRIPSTVVAVPVEGAIVDTVVHVTPGNNQPLVSLYPKCLFVHRFILGCNLPA